MTYTKRFAKNNKMVIVQALGCGKMRFVDCQTKFIEGVCPIIHSFEIAEEFLTMFFTGPHDETFIKIHSIERNCKYRLDRHEPSKCHPEDAKITWIKHHFSNSNSSWVNHKHIWFNEKESRSDAILYAIELTKDYMSSGLYKKLTDFHNSLGLNHNPKMPSQN